MPSAALAETKPIEKPAATEQRIAATLQSGVLAAPLESKSSTSEPGCDIMLLIDSSGSMKHTDPGDYRKNAAKLFISLLDKSNRVGIISFGDSATLLIPLTQNTEQNRKVLFDAVEKITSKERYTNITEAVQKGFNEVGRSLRQNRLMVMMSDGKIDLGSKEKNEVSQSILLGILPELSRRQIPLYTVAFTDESDSALLENMARATRGSFRFAREDKDMHLMFASIFEQIKSPDTVPFIGDSFTIDPDIREATIVVTKKPGTALALVDPSAKKHGAAAHDAAIAWFESSVFDMITIKDPPAGLWQVKLSTNEGNRVYVVTSLRLKSSFDGYDVVQGRTMTFDVWLEKTGEILVEEALLDTTTFAASVSGPDGMMTTVPLARTIKAGGSPAKSAKYSGTFVTSAPGGYTLRILATGQTFQREITVPFKVVGSAVRQAGAHDTSQQVRTPASNDEVSWALVFIRFGIVNLVVFGLAGALLGVRLLIVKMRTIR
jgi:Mg-chelatase subunit ChlD